MKDSMFKNNRRSMSCAVATLFFGSLVPIAASAAVLTFDDIPTDKNGLALINNGYGGLNWNNFAVLDTREPHQVNTGFYHGVVSGHNVALNGAGAQAVTSGSVFNFNGAYLAGGVNNELHIAVSGSLEGVTLYSQTVIVDIYQPTWFQFDYIGIDALTFKTFDGVSAGIGTATGATPFAMDNFTFNEPAVVPVPGAAWLFGSGLFGLTGLARQRKHVTIASR